MSLAASRPPSSGNGDTRAPATDSPVTLADSYERNRRLLRTHGTTYYWATLALPAPSRPHVHALYGLCRLADDEVDLGAGPDDAARRLDALEGALYDGLSRGATDHPMLKAVVFTARAYDLPADAFTRFFRSMRADLTVKRYRDYDELGGYMDGSAAVIGELMLPILEPVDPAAAFGGARDLGVAFQLTNFLRDVGEDLDRGRIYFPRDELIACGVDPDLATRRVDTAWRTFCRFQIERMQALYRSADEAIALLPPRSAGAIRTARVLYSEILDRVAANDFDVFTRRARVPLPRKLAVAARLRVTR